MPGFEHAAGSGLWTGAVSRRAASGSVCVAVAGLGLMVLAFPVWLWGELLFWKIDPATEVAARTAATVSSLASKQSPDGDVGAVTRAAGVSAHSRAPAPMLRRTEPGPALADGYVAIDPFALAGPTPVYQVRRVQPPPAAASPETALRAPG